MQKKSTKRSPNGKATNPRQEEIDKRMEKFEEGLHAFASKAYSDALAVFSPERIRLANAISEILNNPQTPERLYRDVGNFVCDISSQLNDDSPELIARALKFGNCGYAGCPGATADGGVCPGPESDHHKDEQLANLLFTDSRGPEKRKGVRA